MATLSVSFPHLISCHQNQPNLSTFLPYHFSEKIPFLSLYSLSRNCMAVSFLAGEVSDLCLGKPSLRSLPATATVAAAVSALKKSGEVYVTVWGCEHGSPRSGAVHGGACVCVGKVCMVDVICFLAKEENAARPSDALRSPVSELLPKAHGLVRHLEPHSSDLLMFFCASNCHSLLEAIDYILEGAQNLVIPIQSYTSTNSRKKLLKKPTSFGPTLHNGREFCWLTQEDVVRFLLNGISIFSPIPMLTVESLDIIDTDIMTVHYNAPASSMLASISRSHMEQTSIAVVDEDNRLIGEISPFTLACCDETVAAAIQTLSAGDLMAYIDCGGPPEDLVQLVKTRLQEKNLNGMLELVEELSLSSLSSASSSCSSDEEFGLGRRGGSGRYSPARRSEAIVCYPRSSLMAVMIQALAHRVNSVWVVEEDYSLIGNVTFTGMLKIFRSFAGCRTEGDNSFKQ
ncbi:hypothetical protein RJ640_030120 [Escallonia rubra]|uniref:CBS domain-containing protein n=1 Tax=Escallonia rubra TaxID=112253 RepID=A0AA88UAC8_9ASTE|nr:hypothetical protein RJ640_030120 [Escallonia rubra]